MTSLRAVARLLLLPLVLLFSLPALTHADFSLAISVHIGPPALPVYTQPPCPAEGYIWVPGYWAWGPYGYYWVPGVWVPAPRPGLLWTPGYWEFVGDVYTWHPGYWGPHVGYYGGVNYGFGYFGFDFVGGHWEGGAFHYNTAVVNVNRTVVKNVYINKTVINNTTIINNNTRVSYAGPGGVQVRPRPQELMAAREAHIQATSMQMQHEQVSASDRNQLFATNHGMPATAAMDNPHGRRFTPQGQPAPHLQPAPVAAAEAQHWKMQAAQHQAVAQSTRPVQAPTPAAEVQRPAYPNTHVQPNAAPYPQQSHPAPHPEAQREAPRVQQPHPQEHPAARAKEEERHDRRADERAREERDREKR